jgi:hypothetical protein
MIFFHAGKWQDVFKAPQDEWKNSVDLFIPDPPYNIGKGDWDHLEKVTFVFIEIFILLKLTVFIAEGN